MIQTLQQVTIQFGSVRSITYFTSLHIDSYGDEDAVRFE